MRVLISDPVDDQCIDILRGEGFTVDYSPGLPPDRLAAAIGAADALIVRSQTRVPAALLEHAVNLKVIGRAGAGVDSIDVDAATRRGIIVMNTPGGNTISTAEHTLAMILALARNIPPAFDSLKQGKWEKKSFTGVELSGKVVGIVGMGKVGSEVARRLRGFEVRLIAYDPVLHPDAAAKAGVELVGLDDLFRQSDIVTLHCPLTDETRHLVGPRTLALCKRGVRVVNCARGEIVDEKALLDALNSGVVAGAALDVFEKEPPGDNPLLRHARVVATPHLAASTHEAQEKVAVQIAHQVADALRGRAIAGSVNADVIQLAQRKEIKPYIELAERMGRFLAQIMEGDLSAVAVTVSGLLLHRYAEALTSAVMKGLFAARLTEPVNAVNALSIARERGIAVHRKIDDEQERYAQLISVGYETRREQREFAGTVHGANDLRIVSIDGFHFEFSPVGNIVLFSNIDKPGMLASVSAIVARAGVNISGLSLGRYTTGNKALTVLATDTPVPEQALSDIAALEGIFAVKRVSL